MRVAIVGGGFSGVTLALHLAKHPRASRLTALDIIEPGPGADVGRGAAYSTPFASHLLNVRKQNMGAFATAPGDFAAWLHASGQDMASDFVPRRLYGDYLVSRFAAIRDAPAAPLKMRHRCARAIDIEPPSEATPARLILDDGGTLLADRVGLCLGNTPRQPPDVEGLCGLDATQALLQPWDWQRWQALPARGEVLIVGTGLTMVDVVLGLRERGFAGSITALSRHGLLPQAHPQVPRTLPPLGWRVAHLACWLRDIRRAARSATAWQSVIDALRDSTPALWQQLPRAQRATFLRHVKAYWDAHRHRVAPQVAAHLQQAYQAGVLRARAGRLSYVRSAQRRLNIGVRARQDGAISEVQADYLINCTGNDADWRRPTEPFLQVLLRRGLLSPDALGLGAQATADGALLQQDGRPSTWLWGIGTVHLGRDLESVAVPELRRQAAHIATAWLY